MPKAMSRVNLDKIISFKTVLDELVKLDILLPESKLKQFILFNKAYLTVMKEIKKGAKSGYFDNPDFIEKFSVNFARYYFKALNETTSKNKNLPTAWSLLNKVTGYKATPEFIYLLMGANAHINHDLPLALLKLMDKEPTDDLLKDAIKIDKLLMDAGREIIDLFDESNRSLSFVKRNFVFLYYRPTMYMVRYWRVRAWRNYKMLKKVGPANSEYQKKSIAIANRFLKFAMLFN